MKIFKYGFFFIGLFFFSCGKIGVIKNTSINMRIVNQHGKNLLDSPSLLSKDNIDVFHVVNGKANLYRNGQFNASKGYIFSEDESRSKVLRLFPNTDTKNEKFPLTLIKIGDFRTDTIQAAFKFEGASTRVTKIWFNGVLKFDLYAKSGSQTFTIIK